MKFFLGSQENLRNMVIYNQIIIKLFVNKFSSFFNIVGGLIKTDFSQYLPHFELYSSELDLLNSHNYYGRCLSNYLANLEIVFKDMMLLGANL